MARLAYDVARCSNATCEVRETCLRFTDPGHPTYQSYISFEGGENCRYRIPDREKTDA